MSGKTDIRSLTLSRFSLIEKTCRLLLHPNLHSFLRILQQINQYLFYLRTIHLQPLVFVFYLIMEYRIRIKMLQISHQITNPHILKLRFRYALQLAIVLHKLQQTIASPVDSLQCHQQIIMLQRILLHPFAKRISQRDDRSQRVHDFVGQYPHQLLLRIRLILLNHRLHILQGIKAIGKALIKEVDHAQYKVSLPRMLISGIQSLLASCYLVGLGLQLYQFLQSRLQLHHHFRQRLIQHLQVVQVMNRKTAESIHGSPIHPMHLSLFIRHNEKGIDGIEHRSEILVFRFLQQSGFPKFIHHFVNLLCKIPLFSPQMIQ